jgi:predicted alpha/beta-fold hydrolase
MRPGTAFGSDDDDDLLLDLVTVTSEDHHTWDALVARPRGRVAPHRQIAVLVVHGSMGNFLGGLPRRLTLELAHAGYTAMSTNTRMANFGVVYGGGLLHRAPLDLDAALDHLRRHGHRRIVLAGYGQGATMVLHHQTLRRSRDVIGLLTVSHPYSLPLALRRRWEALGADPGYEEVEARARETLGPAPERGRDAIVVIRHGAGATDDPADEEVWTYRTWWFARGPEARHAVSAEMVRELDVPMLVVEPGADPLLPHDDGEALLAEARAGSCPSVELVRVPGCDHSFWERTPEVAAIGADWLGRVCLGGR